MATHHIYDQADFERNRVKYVLFKTASVASHIPHLPELEPGKPVSIEYVCTKKNPEHGNSEMPVYKVLPAGATQQASAALVFACALDRFML